MAKRGATVRHIALPFLDAIHAYVNVVMGGRSSHYPRRVDAQAPIGLRPEYIELALRELRHPRHLLCGSLIAARANPGRVFKRGSAASTCSPRPPSLSASQPSPKRTSTKGPADAHARSSRILANTAAFNYLGLPSVSVNCGFDPNGLPIGISFTGRPFAEACVLKVADAYQQETDWHRCRPLMLA